ncbi:hypothetical protein A3Q56_06976 [Intoshia linei]|uniref:Uncharacterized protein n=1 Tax=Intoshia linei TaxID=1819745 RepID=A0A177AUV3_9BILA|nr:hypothetical protein A3Q56_06976 [Intoshia linei]
MSSIYCTDCKLNHYYLCDPRHDSCCENGSYKIVNTVCDVRDKSRCFVDGICEETTFKPHSLNYIINSHEIDSLFRLELPNLYILANGVDIYIFRRDLKTAFNKSLTEEYFIPFHSFSIFLKLSRTIAGRQLPPADTTVGTSCSKILLAPAFQPALIIMHNRN